MIPAVSAAAAILSEAASPAGALSAAGVASAAAPAPTGAADFEQMLAQVSSGAVEALRTAEATSIQGLEGKASVQKVVEAIMSAQETLQTALAVRDKLVSAYQEVTRMS